MDLHSNIIANTYMAETVWLSRSFGGYIYVGDLTQIQHKLTTT